MDAFIQNLRSQIDQNTQSFQQAFGSLDKDMLNAKPSPDTWSIGQNIHHLIIINESYVPVLKKAHQGEVKVPFWGKWPFVYNMLGNMILKSSGPVRDKKIKTFPIWQPASSDVPADIVQQFVQHQEKLKTLMTNAAPLLQQNTLITSPANANITYTLAKAFEIIVAHEQRHFNQAKEVQEQLAAGSW
ncbi:MAG: DinB family protein [Saprospiraceae bacterium]|nr:DinB family protein [Saprospiraceae bacterium]